MLLTKNDLQDTACLTHNRLSDFHCVYIFIQVVNAEFIKVVRTAFKISREMIKEQAVALVIVALISEKNKSREKRHKGRVCVKPWLNPLQPGVAFLYPLKTSENL